MASEIREKDKVEEEEEDNIPVRFLLGDGEGEWRFVLEEGEWARKRKSVFIRLRAHSDGARKNLTCHGDSYYTDGDYDCNLSAEHRACGAVYLEKQHELFFIGGYTFPRDFKKEVWIYNFQTESFYPGPPMNRPRFNPTVFAYQNNIYVFGGSHSSPIFPEMNFMPPEHFVEFYDSAANAWFYQPSEPPEEIIIDPRSSIAAHALDEENGVVYFWTMPHGVYSYHIQSRVWSSFKLLGPHWAPDACMGTFDACRGYRWSNSTVFLHSCVIWFYFGTIYAYRVTDHLFLPLFTLPDPFITVFGSPKNAGFQPQTYLVDVGDNKLCLVYGNLHNHDSETIRCHTFEVRDSPIQLKFTLEHKGCHVCHCDEDFKIESVHTVNLDDVRLMKRKVSDVSRALPIQCEYDPVVGAQEATKRLQMLWEGYSRAYDSTQHTESSANDSLKENSIANLTPIPPHTFLSEQVEKSTLEKNFIATLSPIPPHSLSEQVNFINNLTQRIESSGIKGFF